MTLLTTADLARVKAERPPSRWRNRWRNGPFATGPCLGACRCAEVGPFEVYLGCKVWPSRDAAESYAKEVEARVGQEFLGAVDIGEAR